MNCIVCSKQLEPFGLITKGIMMCFHCFALEQDKFQQNYDENFMKCIKSTPFSNRFVRVCDDIFSQILNNFQRNPTKKTLFLDFLGCYDTIGEFDINDVKFILLSDEQRKKFDQIIDENKSKIIGLNKPHEDWIVSTFHEFIGYCVYHNERAYSIQDLRLFLMERFNQFRYALEYDVKIKAGTCAICLEDVIFEHKNMCLCKQCHTLTHQKCLVNYFHKSNSLKCVGYCHQPVNHDSYEVIGGHQVIKMNEDGKSGVLLGITDYVNEYDNYKEYL